MIKVRRRARPSFANHRLSPFNRLTLAFLPVVVRSYIAQLRNGIIKYRDIAEGGDGVSFDVFYSAWPSYPNPQTCQHGHEHGHGHDVSNIVCSIFLHARVND